MAEPTREQLIDKLIQSGSATGTLGAQRTNYDYEKEALRRVMDTGKWDAQYSLAERPEFKNFVDKLLPALRSNKPVTGLKDIWDTIKNRQDLPTATDTDITQVRSITEFIKGLQITEAGKELDWEKVTNTLAEGFFEKSPDPGVRQQKRFWAGKVVDSLLQKGDLRKFLKEFEQTINVQKGTLYGQSIDDLRAFTNELYNDELSKVIPDLKLDIYTKPVEDIVKTTFDARTQEAGIAQFQAGLPSELAPAREKFIGTLEEEAKRTFGEQVAPDILANLNIRGLLDSGDLPSELARGAASVFEPIQRAALELREADDNFFANVGYESVLRGELTAGKSLQQAQAFTRAKATGEQETEFQLAQAGIRSQFNIAMGQRRQQQQLSSYERQLKLQQQQQAQAQSRAQSGAFGRAFGGIAGAAAGSAFGPAGLSVGYGLGSNVGESFGGIG